MNRLKNKTLKITCKFKAAHGGITRYERTTLLFTKRLGYIGYLISILLLPFYLILRFVKSIFSKLQLFYETHTAPFLSVKLGWIFWPIYRLLAFQNICFIVNIGDVTGHVILELDYFFRKLNSDQNLKNKRYVWLGKSKHTTRAMVKTYKHKFWFALSNTFVYDLLFPIIIRYKDITLDCGLSQLKWQLTDDLKYHKRKYGHNCLYLLSENEYKRQYIEQLKLRLRSKNYFPLLDYVKVNNNSKLIEFLNGRTERLAMIHIKTEIVNATAKITDPQTYLPAMKYLLDNEYQIVFVGREKMPQEFLAFNIINYANSDIATFEHDIQIFKLAELAITAGSGIAWFPDCFNKPYLFLNSWALPFMLPSPKCISVPTLVQKPSGEFLKFSEQINLCNYSADPKYIPTGYKFRNATGDEILMAMQELIELKDKSVERSQLQEKFRNISDDAPYFWALSRVSNYFLQKHIELF